MDQYIPEFLAWQTACIPQSASDVASKLCEEAAELRDTPSIEEAADVLGCLVAWLNLTGHTWADLEEAAWAKLAVNRARTWARTEDGIWSHVKGPH